jgi:hypothetical protein
MMGVVHPVVDAAGCAPINVITLDIPLLVRVPREVDRSGISEGTGGDGEKSSDGEEFWQ